MTKNRLESFSDAVIAIILTIMVLELKVPEASTWQEVLHLYPLFISYLLSFLFVGIYWVNHHHLFHALSHVNSRILWSNMFLLFFLSLIPWATATMGENHFSSHSVIIYTFLCMLPAVAYSFLSKSIIASRGVNKEVLRILEKSKTKERISLVLYLVAFGVSLWQPSLALVLVFAVSCVWIMPDKEIEKIFE